MKNLLLRAVERGKITSGWPASSFVCLQVWAPNRVCISLPNLPAGGQGPLSPYRWRWVRGLYNAWWILPCCLLLRIFWLVWLLLHNRVYQSSGGVLVPWFQRLFDSFWLRFCVFGLHIYICHSLKPCRPAGLPAERFQSNPVRLPPQCLKLPLWKWFRGFRRQRQSGELLLLLCLH